MTLPLSEPRNRLVQVLKSTTATTNVNGIDFVELKSVDATTLYVHFLNTVPLKTVDIKTTDIKAAISGGDRITGITLDTMVDGDWAFDADGRPLLTLRANQAGDTHILVKDTQVISFADETFNDLDHRALPHIVCSCFETEA